MGLGANPESWQEVVMFPVETSINTNLAHGAAVHRDTARPDRLRALHVIRLTGSSNR